MARKGQGDAIDARNAAKEAKVAKASEAPAGKITVRPTKKRRRKPTAKRMAKLVFREQRDSHKRSACPPAALNRVIRDALLKASYNGDMRITVGALSRLREAAQDYLIDTLMWSNLRGPVQRGQNTLKHTDVSAEVKQQEAYANRFRNVA